MNALVGSDSKRLWNLWDMMRVYAHQYLALGEAANEIRVIFKLAETGMEGQELQAEDFEQIKDGIKAILTNCQDLDLQTAADLLQSRLFDLPKTEREFDLLMGAVYSELKTRTFVYMLPHLAKFYDNHDVLSAKGTLAFHSPRNELWDASNALASGLWTASVFHSMRAAEIGVRILAKKLEVSFPDKPLELAEWQTILSQIDSKITAISQQKRTPERADDQAFYSRAAAEFRYFKDGWRVRVAHAHATYLETEAVKVFEHVRDFFEVLSERLAE